MVSTREFYQRAILDYDGVFRQYRYQKKQSNSGLRGESWSSIVLEPSNICMTDPVSLGVVCGFKSYCKLDGDKPHCLCPTRTGHCPTSNPKYPWMNQCREACLGDCLCAVAIFRGGDWWKKKLPLLNGRMDSTVERKALIKVRKIDSNSPLTPPSSCGRKKQHVTGPQYIHALRQVWVP
ncbi:hypothetical protein MRB53_005321 [Persea americana]|uniref:Uncharacterized protein n=1 Tax=Persea americana TaxID=3435 RepID=A0ACC2MDT4_PERAE|nr:hypothetical protein MRB53_005321 [Persea americana]